MKILLVSNNYPSRVMPNRGAFVYNLAQQLALEHNVTVISPLKITDLFKPKARSYGSEMCKVIRPFYISLGGRKLAGFNLAFISFSFQSLAVNLCSWLYGRNTDIVYSHFLINAMSVFKFSKRHKKPLVIASGESTYNYLGFSNSRKIDELLRYTDHFICVSEKNRDFFKSQQVDDEKITLLPNAVNYDVFKPLDKKQCKTALGLKESDFVVGFVGHFIDRKGPNRVIEAIQLLGDPMIKLVCVGGGGVLLPNSFTKIIGPVPNSELPEIMGSFDIFVLPTLNEGHCNVIEEAKACGLPIVSSRGTTVESQFDELTGFLVNPLDIHEIAAAINRLKADDELRSKIRNNLINKIGTNSIQKRAKKISAILLAIASHDPIFK